jgi:hypothetical protein
MKVLMEGLYEKMKREGVLQKTESRGRRTEAEVSNLKSAIPAGGCS